MLRTALAITMLWIGLPALADVCTGVPDDGPVFLFDFESGGYGSEPGQFQNPWSVATDATGRILVADIQGQRIAVLDGTGQLLFRFGAVGTAPGEFQSPSGVAANAAGRIAVTDESGARVQVFDPAGAFLFSFGSPGSGAGQFQYPEGVTFDAGGRIAVADAGNNRIQVFDDTGSYLFSFGTAGSGPGQLSFPVGVAVDGAGRFVVSDLYNHRIQIFDSTGAFVLSFGSYGAGDGQFQFPWGVAADGSGRIAVADGSNHRIQVFDATGAFLASTGAPGSGHGEFAYPEGVAFRAGGIVVADSGNYRIQALVESTNAADQDGDGTPNCLDGCPTDATKLAPGICGCGIADDDSDGDLVPDCQDGCPLDPDKTFAGACGCGIPDTDSDGDGFADCVDGCPADPAKGVPGLCGCGVPDTDSDGDGAADCQDVCPGITDGPDFLYGFGGLEDGELLAPVGVVVDGMGRIVVADRDRSRIEVFAANGAHLFDFGSPGSGNGQLDMPSSVAVDDSNRIYVADLGNTRVQVFAPDGSYLFQFGGFYPEHVTVDASGRILVADQAADLVRVFDSDGIPLFTFGGPGSGPGQFSGITGVATDSMGRIVTLEFNTYRVQVFDGSGGFQFQFGSYGYGTGQIAGAFDVAVDGSDRILVVDANAQRVDVFDGSGVFQFDFGAYGPGNGQFAAPLGITATATGRILVADTYNRRIQAFDSAGTFDVAFGAYDSTAPGKILNSSDVALDGSGRIVAADAGNNRVQVFDGLGAFQLEIGGLFAPQGVAVDSLDRILVAEPYAYRIDVFDALGALQFAFGTFGSAPGEFNTPGDVATGASDRILVADTGNDRIQVFDASGTFQFAFGSSGTAPGQFQGPNGVTEDPDGRILVADTYNDRIQVFDASGAFLFTVSSFGTGDGELYQPWHVASDTAGRILVADEGNARIQVFDATGTFLFKFGVRDLASGMSGAVRSVALDAAGRFVVAHTNQIDVFAAVPNSADGDGDGVANCVDGCPADAAKVSPGACGCGIPDTDTDLDGTPDCVDGCPTDATKTMPGTCGCGVPESPADTDLDGFPDCLDACPDDPNPAVPGGCSCWLDPPGLVGWWPGDGTAEDAANGNHGTLAGGVGFSAGHVGQAFQFDGVDGEVGEIGMPSTYAFLQNTGVFGIVAWIRLLDPSSISEQVIVGNAETGTEKGVFFLWENSAGERKLRLGLVNGSGVPVVDATSAADAITDSEWHHVVVIGDGNAVTFYVDGALSPGAGTIGTPGSGDSTRSLTIGSIQGAFAFHGEIDEVQLYDRALTTSDISGNFATAEHGLCRCIDADGDGHGLEASPACPMGLSVDCDDTGPAVHPGAIEVGCDGVDNDCDGQVDEGSAGTCECTTAGTGLVSFWTGDGETLDVRGGHDGTLEDGATYGVGLAGEAFHLDGVDDRVSILGSEATYSFVEHTGVFTIAAWIRLDDPDALAQRGITGNVYSTVQRGHAFLFDNLDGSRRLRLLLVNGTAGVPLIDALSAPDAVTDSGWHHVAAVGNGSGVMFYVDGVSSPGSGTMGTPGTGDSTYPLAIGDCWGVQCPFAGEIDEVQIYDRSLGASEIAATFGAGPIGGNCRCIDDDGDGYGMPSGATCPHGTLGDCNDTDASSWQAPLEVQDLRLASSGSTGLTWLGQSAAIGPGVTYDVLRGIALPVGSPGEECLDTGLVSPSSLDASPPAPGTLFTYLVRAANGCGVGSYGARSDGTPRLGSACP